VRIYDKYRLDIILLLSLIITHSCACIVSTKVLKMK